MVFKSAYQYGCENELMKCPFVDRVGVIGYPKDTQLIGIEGIPDERLFSCLSDLGKSSSHIMQEYIRNSYGARDFSFLMFSGFSTILMFYNNASSICLKVKNDLNSFRDPSEQDLEVLFRNEYNLLLELQDLESVINPLFYAEVFTRTRIAQAIGFPFETSKLFSDKKKSTSRKEKLAFLLKTGEAISEIHKRGIVHMDLKPSNIFYKVVDGVPRPLIFDFGLSWVAGKKHPLMGLTAGFRLIGTPEYFDFFQEEFPRFFNDQYSFGCMLYESLVGVPPYHSKETRINFKKKISGDLSILEQGLACAGICGDLVGIVLKCLDKYPQNRYESMDQVVEAIRNVDFDSLNL